MKGSSSGGLLVFGGANLPFSRIESDNILVITPTIRPLLTFQRWKPASRVSRRDRIERKAAVAEDVSSGRSFLIPGHPPNSQRHSRCCCEFRGTRNCFGSLGKPFLRSHDARWKLGDFHSAGDLIASWPLHCGPTPLLLSTIGRSGGHYRISRNRLSDLQ